MSERFDRTEMMTIGGVSALTGVPPETLRTWERRYGFPSPERSEGGHRMYSEGTVDRLRQAVRAIDMGYRPGAVLQMSEAEVASVVQDALALLERVGAADRDAPPEPIELVGLWIEYARAFNMSALERSFERAWYTHGVRGFLETYTTRLEFELDERVRLNALPRRHADFLELRMRGFLAGHLRELACRSSGPTVLCALALDQRPSVGAYAAAVLMALCGCRVITLSAGTSPRDLRESALDLGDTLSGLYVHADAKGLYHDVLLDLSRELSPTCELTTGGSNAHDLEGVLRFEHLGEITRWAPMLFTRHTR